MSPLSRYSLAAALSFASAAFCTAGDWMQWRGPLGNGVSQEGKPPTEWSESKNMKWKVAVPGLGHGSPIVYKNRVYLLTAIKADNAAPAGDKKDDFDFSAAAPGSPDRAMFVQEPPPDGPPRQRPQGDGAPRGDRPRGGGRREAPTETYKFVVMALDRNDGKVVWQTTVKEAVPHEGTHPDGTLASASPVTDGERIYAFFGSRGLHCLDLDGKVLWSKDLGQMRIRNSFGEGASPALHGDTIVVVWDHEGDDFIVSFDKKTGDEKWRKSRDEPTSWATPYVVDVGGKTQIIANAARKIRGYDIKSGDVLWECGGMTENVIPTPVYKDGMLIAMSGFRGAAIRAIKLAAAKGDISDSKDAILWSYDKDTPYVPSPLLYDDTLYFLNNNRAMLTCLNAKTGEKHYGPERLDGLSNVYASIVGAAGHVYIVGRDGKTFVMKHGKELNKVALNVLDDGIDASPAIADNELFLRGREHLYCIASK